MRRTALLLVISGACSAPVEPAPLVNHVAAGAERIVTLERTECLSGCPEYTVELWSDGSVAWNGAGAVATVGPARGQMVPADVDRIVAAFTAAGFFELDRRTPKFLVNCNPAGKCVTTICEVTDEPTAKVTIRHHTVEIHRCTAQLDAAVDLIDALAHTKRWISP